MQPGTVRFVLADPHRRLASVRLVAEFDVAGSTAFARVPGGWELRLARPAVDRMEYLLEVTDHNARCRTILDPGNPRQAPGAFGAKSVLELPGYRAPDWLSVQGDPGSLASAAAAAPALDAEIGGEIWSAPGLSAREPAPLLIVHDGPEYAELGDLLGYLRAGVATGALPPLRAALLGPVERNAWYSANPDYAEALETRLLPALPPATLRIGIGVSLGALAMVHAHERIGLDALFLQSGSFFTPELDAQESGFDGFAAVTSFVAGMSAAERDPHPVPAVLTCGLVEENLANNRAMTATLARLGYGVELVEVRDAHNFVAWRDALHPHLPELITRVTARRAA